MTYIPSTEASTEPRTDRFEIVIVDDHPIVRKGLAQLIATESDLQVVGEASDVAEALAMIDQLRPALVIVDLSLKNHHNGLELIRHLNTNKVKSRVLVCSMHEDPMFVERSLRAGARGYVNKDEAPEQLLSAIRRVLAGEIYVHAGEGNPTPFSRIDPAIDQLTPRELQIFRLFGRGMTSRQIAAELGLSKKTVDNHRENIKRKLKTQNSAELIRRAVEWSLHPN